MREMREAYATQYLCEVTYSYVEALWNEANAAEEPDENPDGAQTTAETDGEEGTEGGEETQSDTFPAFCSEYVDYVLGLCDKWGYDGVVVWFDGPRSTSRARPNAPGCRPAARPSSNRWPSGAKTTPESVCSWAAVSICSTTAR